MRFKKRVDELELELPFILHAGETLGDGSAADNNLYDAILLGTKRIGHGSVDLSNSCSSLLIFCSFSLVKHPKLIEIVKKKNITIEVCPISYVLFYRALWIFRLERPAGMRFWLVKP